MKSFYIKLRNVAALLSAPTVRSYELFRNEEEFKINAETGQIPPVIRELVQQSA